MLDWTGHQCQSYHVITQKKLPLLISTSSQWCGLFALWMLYFFLFSQNSNAVTTPENDITISSNPDQQPDANNLPPALSDDQIPGPSRTSEIDNDNISNISDFYDSDDSVADPNFSVSDLFNSKYATTIESDDEVTELVDFLETREPTIRPILPKSDEIKPVFIATYPNSIIFKDQQQAISFNAPQSQIFEELTNKVNFIAKYPGPIIINDENSEEMISQITTRTENSKIQRNKLKYPFIEEMCGNGCKRQCKSFTIGERKNIWENFWNLPYLQRRHFLNKCIRIENVKRRKVTEPNPNSKFFKSESRYYYLTKGKEALNVCRNFFLKTLGFKTDAVITELSRAIKRKGFYEDVKENRGGKKKRLNRNAIMDHILSFNPAVSHYRRRNAPLARYLPRSLTLNFMFNDFKKKNSNENKCSKEIYRQTLKDMNISFKFPKGDKCVVCAELEEEMKQYSSTEIPENVTAKYDAHKAKANKAICQYQLDAGKENTNTIRYYSMDLQKVMLLPDMSKVKDSFFLSRLVAFNLTFAPVQKMTSVKSTCVLWHEAWAGRDANNIVDAFIAFLENQRDLQHLTIWCDNCTSQNKNWILYTAFVTLVNCGLYNIESITLKYLTKGHTHMTADGVHGNIEARIKRQDAVYDFEDYKQVIFKCRKNIEVVEVKKAYQWSKKKRSPRRNDENDLLKKFLVNQVVEVKFINGCRNLFYKEDFDESFVELDFLMKKFNIKLFPEMTDSPRGVKPNKKEGIVSKLVPLMPLNRRHFWYSLPTNDKVEDLVTRGQIEHD